MPEIIIGGSGTQYPLVVNSDGSINVSGISIGSLSASVETGSTAYMHGSSGTGWLPLAVTEDGKLEVATTVSIGSIETGSVVYQGVKPWEVTGSFSMYDVGSSLITNFPSTYPGSVVVTNQVYAGSENWIKNFSDIGSSRVITNLYAGSESWIIGSVAITNSLSVETGSETWIRGGSIQPYNPVGIGSSLITNFPTTYPGSVTITNSILPVSGVVNTQLYAGSESWIKNFNDLGSSVVVTNFNDLGSSVVVTNLYTGSEMWQGTNPWEVTGSVQIYNPIGIGSSLITNFPDSYPGSVYQATSPWIVLGSVNVDNQISLGSESYIPAGSVIVTSIPSIVGSVYNIEVVPTSLLLNNARIVIEYSGLDAVGSIYKMIGTGSYVQTLTYDVSGNVIEISSWSSL
jgi:hypothetical protein